MAEAFNSRPDEPNEEGQEEEDDAELQRQDDAYSRIYENEHTWDTLQEDEHGLLRMDKTAEQRAKRRRLLSAAQSARIRKGMIRYVMLVVDLSIAALGSDLRPNRLSCMLTTCKNFIREFFDQNPLSQLGILLMRNGLAERLTELSGSPESQIKKLSERLLEPGSVKISMFGVRNTQREPDFRSLEEKLPEWEPDGIPFILCKSLQLDSTQLVMNNEGIVPQSWHTILTETCNLLLCHAVTSGNASLQNMLDLSISCLKHIPPYGHREVLVMSAALSTCDPGSVFDSVKAAKEHHIRVSVVGVAAEVYVCSRLAKDTGGTYGVALSESHLEELMLRHAPPPAATAEQAGAELVRMGFPQRSSEDPAAATFVGPNATLASGSYGCPRCKAKVAELPCECHVCGLTLVSSPHLARSYHHLFPIAPYDELHQASEDPQASSNSTHGGNTRANLHAGSKPKPISLECYGCCRSLGEEDEGTGQGRTLLDTQQMILTCTRCHQLFCFECDSYVHESLHNCPGCESMCCAVDVAPEVKFST